MAILEKKNLKIFLTKTFSELVDEDWASGSHPILYLLSKNQPQTFWDV